MDLIDLLSFDTDFRELVAGQGGWVFPLIPLAVGGCVLAWLNLSAAWKQRSKGAGGLWRLVWVSIVFSCMQGSHVLLLWMILAMFGRQIDNQWDLVLVASAATILNISVLTAKLTARGPRLGRSKPLPLVKEAAILDRVRQLSSLMGIGTPVVRLCGSLGGNQAANGWASGFVERTLIITDGIRDRLTPLERDSVLAHELAHFANRSLWIYAGLVPLSAMGAVVAALFVPFDVALAFAAAFAVGVTRIVSRVIERDCDRRAGAAIGYREMASALRKLDAVNSGRRDTWVKRLFYAVATHPHLESRLAALHRSAPENERPAIAYSTEIVRQQQILGQGAAVIWLATIVATFVIRPSGVAAHWACVPLLLTVVGPHLLAFPQRWKNVRLENRRRGRTFTWLRFVALLAVAAALWLAFQSALLSFVTDESLIPLLATPVALMILTAMLILIARTNGRNELLTRMRQALQDHDFERVLELGRSNRAIVMRNPELRHNFALASDQAGYRESAIDQLEQLRRDKPRFRLSPMLLTWILLDDGQVGRALDVAQQIAHDLPQDPGVQYLLAYALRRAGDLNRAHAALGRARAMHLEAGEATALEAGIAVERGDYERARQLIGTALEQAPGSAYVLIEKARLAHCAEPPEAARVALKEAGDAVRANPFTYLRHELAALEGTATVTRSAPALPVG